MKIEYTRETAMSYLARLLRDADDQTEQMIRDRDGVYRVYGRMFRPDNLGSLSAEDLKEFLLYENNRHWLGIHRYQKKLVADIGHTQAVFRRLLDESETIVDRLDWIEGSDGAKPLLGLGKAVYTPILHVVFPDSYGVWNSVAEMAMNRLSLWPVGSGRSFGQQYEKVNAALHEVADELGTDLWTVDALWWRVEREAEPTKHQEPGSGGGSSGGGRVRHKVEQFTCERCWTTKPVNLRARDEGDVCVDCD